MLEVAYTTHRSGFRNVEWVRREDAEYKINISFGRSGLRGPSKEHETARAEPTSGQQVGQVQNSRSPENRKYIYWLFCVMIYVPVSLAFQSPPRSKTSDTVWE